MTDRQRTKKYHYGRERVNAMIDDYTNGAGDVNLADALDAVLPALVEDAMRHYGPCNDPITWTVTLHTNGTATVTAEID